ncbi:MAG: YetF domain-containing protein [Syntrophothermus sp.]
MPLWLMALRIILIYFVALVLVRFLGKRELGKLTPFDFVVIIALGEVIAAPFIDDKIKLSNVILALALLVALQLFVSWVSLKSEKIRTFFGLKPTIIIQNGKIVEKNMKKLKYNMGDLLEQLRQKNLFNIADVEFAVLETSGQLSVIPKSQNRPVTPKDLGIPTQYEGIPTVLITDGHIAQQNLAQVGLTEAWLRRELAKQGVQKVEDVLLASLDTEGKLFLAKKKVADTPLEHETQDDQIGV